MNNKFTKEINNTNNLYYISDFVNSDNVNKEYILKFNKYNIIYSRSGNNGFYVVKFYY